MKRILGNKKLFFCYAALLILSLVSCLILKIESISPIKLIIVFSTIVLVPGFAIGRLLNLIKTQDLVDKIAISVVLGLITIFSLNLLALFIGISINILIFLTISVSVLLFVGAIIKEFLRPEQEKEEKFKFSSLINFDSILYLIFLILAIATILIVTQQGTLVKGGDPAFHMAIVRKAMDSGSLVATNLGLVKSSSVHVTYGFPVWHVFIAELGKLFSTDLFSIWKAIVAPLSLLIVFIWFWLSRKIMPNKSLAIFSGIVFLIYMINKNNGYLFICSAIPDTFNNLIMMPLVLGLVLDYLFDKTEFSLKKNWLTLLMITGLAILAAVVHLTQYFYILMIIFVFGLVYGLLFLKEQESRNIWKKSLWLLLGNLIILTPLVLVLFLKTSLAKTLTGFLNNNSEETLPSLSYYAFKKFNTLAKYAYIFSPFLLFFVRRYRTLVFLIVLFLILPLTYFGPIKFILMKTLGYIFVNRIYSSLVWHFILWALGFGLVFLLVEKLFAKIAGMKKYLSIFINLSAIIIFYLFWLANSKYNLTDRFYVGIYSDKIDQWMNQYYGLVIAVLLIAGLVIFYWQKKKPILSNVFELKPTQTLWMPVFVLIFGFLMLHYNFDKYSPFLKDSIKNNVLVATTSFDATAIYNGAGGKDFVNFVNENIPSQSVVLVPGNIIFNLPLVTDVYMAGYPRSSNLDRSLMLYDKTLNDAERLAQIKKAKLNYILFTKNNASGIEYFNSNPSLYQKVYDNKLVLFKVSQ